MTDPKLYEYIQDGSQPCGIDIGHRSFDTCPECGGCPACCYCEEER